MRRALHTIVARMKRSVIRGPRSARDRSRIRFASCGLRLRLAQPGRGYKPGDKPPFPGLNLPRFRSKAYRPGDRWDQLGKGGPIRLGPILGPNRSGWRPIARGAADARPRAIL